MTPELPVNLRYLEGTDNRLLDMVVVIPVARCEWHLAMKLLRWLDGLRDSPELIVFCAPPLTQAECDALAACAHCTIVRGQFKDTGYFGGANNMVKGSLDYVEKHHPGKAMLYIEADAIPIRSGWFDDILDEYRGCGMPFMGDVHLCEQNHMTGNAVYHPNWRTIAPMLAALPGPDPEWGWDSMAADDTFTRCHRAKTIQQIWRPPLPITEAWAAANIRPSTALFHQVKDGSLIDVLCKRQGLPLIPDEKQLEVSSYAKGRQTESPFAAKLTAGQRYIAGIPAPGSRMPSTSILYVTFKRDMEFLRYSLKSVEKFASGFEGVTIAVPSSERGLYNWAKKANILYFDEQPGKGFVEHMAMKCCADLLCPDAQAILLMDADCMFWQPATPADFFRDGKPLIVRERYASIKNPNRLLWQKAVELALGFKPEYECMVRHPAIHLRDTFKRTRDAIAKHTGELAEIYIRSCRNEFPQTFAELNTLGAIAIRDFRDRYACEDYEPERDNKECGVASGSHQYLYRRDRDKVVEVWSHGTIDRYRSDIEAWLAGRTPSYFVK